MAKPTESQVRALEKAHKTALALLLQSIKFRKLIYNKVGSKHPDWQKYADLIWKLWQSWYNRQLKYEKAGAWKEGIKKDDWVTPEGNKKLEALLKKWNSEVVINGIGFIPLLIWAVIAIAGFFTADQIVDELNTTTQEQQELTKSSEEIAQKYGFNKEETKKFLTQQTEAVNAPDDGIFGGLFSGIVGKVFLFGGITLVVMNKDKIFKSKTT